MTYRTAPSRCSHRDRLFICGGHGGGPGHYARYGVTVCRDCGQFHAYKEEDGATMTVEFTIHGEALEAAGQYERWINEKEPVVYGRDEGLTGDGAPKEFGDREDPRREEWTEEGQS